MDLLPNIKVEIVFIDELVDLAFEAIRSMTQTGKVGEGKIFVISAEEIIRIYTGKYGREAL